jgi:uncharacterized membrane protein
MRLITIGTIGFLVTVGVLSSITHYFVEPYNPGFLKYPLITNLHVVLGAVYLVAGAIQFVPRIRNRWPVYHRWAGRALVGVALVVGSAALFMALVIPFSGWPGRLGNGFFALFFLFSLTQGFLAIRRREIARHREWMIRAFALALGIATMRLMFVPALMIAGVESQSDPIVATLSVVSFMSAFILHLAVAEFWIRHTRLRSRAIPAAASLAVAPDTGA